MRRSKDKRQDSSMQKLLKQLLIFFVGGIIGALFAPFGGDIYQRLSTKYFPKAAIIQLSCSSVTTERPLNAYRDANSFYEITFIRIENSGSEATQDGSKLKIQARGKLLGITPSELSHRLTLDKNSDSVGYLDISALKPGGRIEGELHSYSGIQTDMNEAQLGFDRVGNYKLAGPNKL